MKRLKKVAVWGIQFACILGLLSVNEPVYAQEETPEPTSSNIIPSITLIEPQQNLAIQAGTPVTIHWNDDDPDDSAAISIAYDFDDDPTNNETTLWIVQDLSEDVDENGDLFVWDTTGVPGGTYHLWAVIQDGINAPVYSVSSAIITILELPEPGLVPTAVPTITPTETPVPEPAQTPTPELPFHWTLEFIGLSEQPNLENSTINKLVSEGKEVTRQSESILLQGSRDLQELRDTLYSELDELMNFIGGEAEVDIEIPVHAGNLTSILLESNLSTGYRWSVSHATVNGESIHFTENYVSRGGIGIPYIQVFSFNPTSSGNASIQLRYFRSFEESAEVSRRLTLQMNTAESTIDFSNPTQYSIYESIDSPEQKSIDDSYSSDSVPNDLTTADALPSSFDWRDYGGVTPIRNHHSYGSCWAFATVGTMESAIAIRSGQYVDLSEQFLVDCNYDRWSCNGGGTAHKYHYDALGKNQSSIGAVLEIDKPYTNSDDTCSAITNHPYLLNN